MSQPAPVVSSSSRCGKAARCLRNAWVSIAIGSPDASRTPGAKWSSGDPNSCARKAAVGAMSRTGRLSGRTPESEGQPESRKVVRGREIPSGLPIHRGLAGADAGNPAAGPGWPTAMRDSTGPGVPAAAMVGAAGSRTSRAQAGCRGRARAGGRNSVSHPACARLSTGRACGRPRGNGLCKREMVVSSAGPDSHPAVAIRQSADCGQVMSERVPSIRTSRLWGSASRWLANVPRVQGTIRCDIGG